MPNPHHPPRTARDAPLVATYTLRPAGLADRCCERVTAHAGAEVQKMQPTGCPANGTMRMCYVQRAASGEFIGLVNEASLIPTGRRAPLRDLAAEARARRAPTRRESPAGGQQPPDR
jgi:hypothetical protein